MAELNAIADGRFVGGGVRDIPRADVLPDEEAVPCRKFKVLYLPELLELPEPEWLIESVLLRYSLALIYGEPACGKTFLALALALHIVAGWDWCGRKVKQGVVLYVAAEGLYGLKQRVKASAGQCLRDEADPLRSGFAVVGEAVRLLEPDDVEALIEAILEMPVRPDLVVIDTLARCMVPGDENKASDMGQFIAACDRVRMETGAAVLVVHHSRKDALIERGSSALRGAVDTVISVKKDGDIVRLNCEKQKDGPEFGEQRFRLEQVEVGLDKDGGVLTSCRLVPVVWIAAERRAGDPGAEDPDEAIIGALRESFFEDGASGTSLLAASGLKKPTFYRHLRKLVDEARIERFPHGKDWRYRLPTTRQDEPVSVSVSPSLSSLSETDDASESRSLSLSLTPPLKGGDGETDTETESAAGLKSNPERRSRKKPRRSQAAQDASGSCEEAKDA